MSAFTLQQTLAGRGFIGNSVLAGALLPIATSTSVQTIGLWNPAGSGVDCVLDKLMLGVATANTAVVASLNWSATLNAGSSIGTAAPIVAFNSVAIINSKVGRGSAPQARFTNAATNTLTAAPTFLMAVGMAQTAGTAPIGPQAYVFDHDGCLIVPPGMAIWLGGSASPVSVTQVSLTWVEIPTTG